MMDLTDRYIRLIQVLQDPLPLVERPYEEIARCAGMTEDEVVNTIQRWLDDGVIRRFGARVRHQAVGYTANGMCVWDVPAEKVEEAGKYAAALTEVSHCYTRPRLPQWPYNFYAMIHAKEERVVLELADQITRHLCLPRPLVLFSTREFKKSSPRLFCER